MLYYDRIDITEGIDLAKNNNSKECMLSVNINVTAVITGKNVDYGCIIHNISKSEAISFLKSSLFEDRGYI